MKVFAIIFLCFSVIMNSYSQTERKKFVSKDPRFKFSFEYPTIGWLLIQDVKQPRMSRFRDVAMLKTMNRINQIRISTYNGMDSPNVREVSKLVQAEFVREEIRPGEQYIKLKDLPLNNRVLKNANAQEGRMIFISYYDRLEGELYTIFYIFYNKVIMRGDITTSGEDTIMGRAYIIRVLIKKKDYRRLRRQFETVIRTFKYINN